MKDSIKFTLRKLGFLLVLAALIYAPFGVQAYKMAVTTDPFILMAREIADHDPGVIDVVNVWERPEVRQLIVLVNIEPYSRWTGLQRENFQRYVLDTMKREVRETSQWATLEILIGWGYPSEEMVVRRITKCPELSTHACSSEEKKIQVNPEYIKWPGIGKP